MELAPAVSAVITTFNRAYYLKKAIASVLAQDFQHFELIILDNSSTDQTEAVVNSFDDPRLCYVKHPPLNISETRNLGVQTAQGEFVAFLDDDDEWLPKKLSSQYQFFKNASSDVALVYGGFHRIDVNGTPFYTHQPNLKGKILKELLLMRNEFTGSASNPMLRKSTILKLGGFDNTVKTGEDWEFYLRLAQHYRVEYIDQPVVNIRHHHGARLGDRLYDYIDLEKKVMHHFDSLFNQEKKLKAFYLQRIGGKYIRIGDKKNGKKYLFASMKNNPFNIYVYVQWLSSLLSRNFYQKCHNFYLNRRRPFKV